MPKMSLAAFAKDKGFTETQLRQYGVREGEGGIVIPYYDAAGNQWIKYRIRDPLNPDKERRWRWSRGEAEVVPYGLQRPVKGKNFLVVVEGESDCWALWENGVAALGVPGAKMMKCLKVDFFEGVERIAVIREPDEAGSRFPYRVAQRLYEQGFTGSVYEIALPTKDARELYNTRNGSFRSDLQAAWKQRKLVQRAEIDLPALTLRPLSSYASRPVSWLWNQRIPVGKITVLGGDGGEGKSFLTMAMASAVTVGAQLPGGSIPTPADVIVWNAEDDPDDTVLPRAQACGADLNRIHILEDVTLGGVREKFRLKHLGYLCDALEKLPQVALIVIDPISAFLEDCDSKSDVDVRSRLQPLVEMARNCKVAVLMVMHLNKGDHGSILHRLNGSVAFGALPRSVLFAGTHALTGQKSIDCIKHNLSAGDPEPIEFAIDPRLGRVEWRGINMDLTAKAIYNSKLRANRGSQGEGAVEMLAELLANGPVESAEVYRLADDRGVSKRTLERAKAQLGIRAKKAGLGEGSRWFWELPEDRHSPNTINGGVRRPPTASFEESPPLGYGGVRQDDGGLQEEMTDDQVNALFDRAGELGL